MRFRHRTIAGLVAGSVALGGLLVPVGAASADEQQTGTVHDLAEERAGSARAIPYTPYEASVKNVDQDGFTVVIRPSCGLAHRCLSYLRIPSVGIDRPQIDAVGGYRVSWPSNWAEGSSRSDGAGFSNAIDIFGGSWWARDRGKSLGTITRPYKVRSLTASVSSVDNGGRSAVLRGSATPGAEITVGGTKIATVDTSGSWSGTVRGLKAGKNDLTVVQRIYDADQNQQGVSVTVTDGITARVASKDDDKRTARVEGTATPGASIRLGGSTVATASSSGSWSTTVTGLAVGSNRKTFEQYVNGTFKDSASVTITIADPGLPDRIVGETGASDLTRGETGSVTATYSAKSAIGKPKGSAMFTAPEGTTFATGQDALRGQVLQGGEWEDFAADTLVQGKRSADGKSYEYTLADRDLGVAADQRVRWSIRVDVPQDLTAASGELTARLQGSVTAGTFDTTATTTTTFVDAKAPFNASVTFPDDVTQRVVVGGDGEPGARVDLYEGSVHVSAATVGADGKWSVRLAAPDRGGVRELRAEQTIGSTPSGSVPVRIDYGIAMWITSPGNGYQISPFFPKVRISGFAAPGSRVVVSEEGTSTVFGTVTAGADGKWAVTTPALQQRDHLVVATATGPGANTTTATVSLVPSN